MGLCIYNVNFREDPSPRILVVALFFFNILYYIINNIMVCQNNARLSAGQNGGFPYPYGLFKK